MDNFKKILVDIQDLIKSSNGNLINYGKSNFLNCNMKLNTL